MLTFYGTRLSDNMAETPEGYLICYDVNIARIGTQEYLGSELGVSDDIVVVDRPASEVFKPATIASFEGKPFTNDHPYELLDASNTTIYSKGHLQNVRVSDDKQYLVADIIIMDKQVVQDVKNGKREVSAGYNCDCLQDENGNWYQANIIGNHVALVDKGRAGEQVRINDAEWNEANHPRAKNGQFSKGGGGSAPNQEKSESGDDTNKQRAQKSFELAQKASKGEKLTEEEQAFLKEPPPSEKKSESSEKSKGSEGIKSKITKQMELEHIIDDFYEEPLITEEQSNRISEVLGVKITGDELYDVIDKNRDVYPSGQKSDDYNIANVAKDLQKLANDKKKKQKEQEKQKEDNHKRSLLEYDLKSMLKKISPYADYRYDPEDKTLEVRYLGEWEGDDGTGDYDWQTPTAETVKKVKEVQEQFKKRFGYNLSVGSGEKNWMYFNIKDNKEKTMKDNKSVLGKLLKAFAKDAEPEEMVEALEAVKGKEDEEPDRIEKLEAMVQDLCARMDAYDEAHKPEEPEKEFEALDACVKDLEEKDEDDTEDDEKKEVKDENANNDPKLIEAISEKAQKDEETVEEIKKEISDAKKVIARIEDKEVRLAVADSFATIFRGKIKSSENYKKLMDASNKKPEVAGSSKVDYNEVFKKIKEARFRK